ncbi:hypothetical protein A3D14_02375, partial [Candidatus Saccharibacteria bacterium RIFCSPHIGHO2_02_FULL_47_12]
KMLLLAVTAGMLIEVMLGAFLLVLGLTGRLTGGIWFGLALLLAYPVLWAHLAVLPLVLGRYFIVKPFFGLHIQRSKSTFAKHKGVKIAVAGSFGKTSMKEMLLTVLTEGKKVAATPANRNVSISHAQFARSLKGDEDILIIEYGEGAPGDVARFSRTTMPQIGIITGLAPAHLDKYKTLTRAGQDIFSLADYLGDKNIYVNGENEALKPFIKKSHVLYGLHGVDGWSVHNVKVGIHGLSFSLKKGEETLNLKSKLLGRHQVGPLSLVASLASKLGLKPEQIEKGIAKIMPYEHRMQPRHLSGAWIIDDTYNGNIEGMRAGLALLKELPAKRKIYVTPGLVDQGSESAAIHRQLGGYIADVNPDIVVLMQHSVTTDIISGLEEGGYKGQLVIEQDPLNFYNNLEHFIAAGDAVLMQNDWPDQYN